MLRKSFPNFIRTLCLLLSLVMLASAMPPCAFAVTQSEIDVLRAERDAITEQRQQKQAEVDWLEAEEANIIDRKRALDERSALAEQQMMLNYEEIELYDRMIEEKNLDIDEARRLEAVQLGRYRQRVRAMEENGGVDLLGIILHSGSVSDLLSAIDDMAEIMQSDKNAELAYREARRNTEKVIKECEEYRIELNARQDELLAEQEELQSEIDEATQLILGIAGDIENRQAVLDEISAAEDAANAAIDKMVAELEEARRQAAAAQAAQAAQSAAATGTASFMWPVASYVYISSRFGLRTHPITGEQKSHTGLDIAANQGTTVYASDGGTVTMAGWNSGYGNCIMIDHGNGYVTLYGHLNYIGVTNGQSVSQGSVIGQVGSTGASTGPHLHFEVLKNGSRIDPEQFFSGLVFSQNAGV